MDDCDHCHYHDDEDPPVMPPHVLARLDQTIARLTDWRSGLAVTI